MWLARMLATLGVEFVQQLLLRARQSDLNPHAKKPVREIAAAEPSGVKSIDTIVR
jgi:hypothetical protein